ncbi:MAG TPA: winged helix-turn-helix transcriptional regulator [Candidatus Limnocylindrales bacterium]|nr:winged helix-turn-helix transcriptional regulator [Candidatus Limnocylindrales bacterium]
MDAAQTSEGTAAMSTRLAILFALRREGALSADRLAARVGISRTAALQQLRSLTADGAVVRQTHRHGVGRPRHVYDLTAAAQRLFPQNYAPLAADLVTVLAQQGGGALLEGVFAERRERLATVIRRRFEERGLGAAPLADRVAELARFQDEQGYLCEAMLGGPDSTLPEPLARDGDGMLRLREHNCAIYDVAVATPAACRAEIQLFEEVLGAPVTRETHIAAGERSCTYRIGAAPDPSPA